MLGGVFEHLTIGTLNHRIKPRKIHLETKNVSMVESGRFQR
jgi:hypothetical protein